MQPQTATTKSKSKPRKPRFSLGKEVFWKDSHSGETTGPYVIADIMGDHVLLHSSEGHEIKTYVEFLSTRKKKAVKKRKISSNKND